MTGSPSPDGTPGERPAESRRSDGWPDEDWTDHAWPDDAWPDEDWTDDAWPDDGWPDDDWPDESDWPAEIPVPAMTVGAGTGGLASDARRRVRRIVALTGTAVVALGLGAGAVAIFENAAASSSAPAPGNSRVVSMMAAGPVIAVSRSSVTVGGPGRSVTAMVTSATEFSGSVRGLGSVRVGDSVVAQVVLSGGVARLVSLQDPASQP
jgi:hypothetical protein